MVLWLLIDRNYFLSGNEFYYNTCISFVRHLCGIALFYYNLTQSGRRLKELRDKKDKAYTQERVAEEVGISREYLNRLETGKKGCSVDLLVIFAQYYDVTMNYITYGEEETNHVINVTEKMNKLPVERRILAGKLINSI